jgi:hypothetical protein
MNGNPFSGVQFSHVPFFKGEVIESKWNDGGKVKLG